MKASRPEAIPGECRAWAPPFRTFGIVESAAKNVGFAYYKLGDFGESIRWPERATTIDPNRVVSCVNRADLYYRLNRGEEARANCEKYLQLILPTYSNSRSIAAKCAVAAALPPNRIALYTSVNSATFLFSSAGRWSANSFGVNHAGL